MIVRCVLRYINPHRLFNIKSSLFTHIYIYTPHQDLSTLAKEVSLATHQ